MRASVVEGQLITGRNPPVCDKTEPIPAVGDRDYSRPTNPGVAEFACSRVKQGYAKILG
jgi:hypothetical protein